MLVGSLCHVAPTQAAILVPMYVSVQSSILRISSTTQHVILCLDSHTSQHEHIASNVAGSSSLASKSFKSIFRRHSSLFDMYSFIDAATCCTPDLLYSVAIDFFPSRPACPAFLLQVQFNVFRRTPVDYLAHIRTG